MEHPLLFTTEMVKAILDGRKTHTRRVPVERYRNWKVGETIWVRETFSACKKHVCGFDANGPGEGWIWDKEKPVIYRATCNYPKDPETYGGYGWKPSIHMPRWAARIFLKITGLRDERVQDISESDAKAEGCHTVPIMKPSEEFAALWHSINSKRHDGIYAWPKNPKVKVIEYKRITEFPKKE